MDEQDLGHSIVGLTPTLYHVCYGLLRNETDREDAVQTAIEKAWRKAGDLKDKSKLKPWLTRILINECYTLLRKKQREILTDEIPEDINRIKAQPFSLHEALLSLPDSLRLPIVLHYMEGFSIEEIAAALRCPRGTILSRMNRGRKQLKMFLTEVNFDDER